MFTTLIRGKIAFAVEQKVREIKTNSFQNKSPNKSIQKAINSVKYYLVPEEVWPTEDIGKFIEQKTLRKIQNVA